MRGWFLAAAAAIFTFPMMASAQTPARTGEAERAGGPLRVVSESTAAVFMVAGSRPTARPARPVDAWFWTFHRVEQTAGAHRYDILVTRERMDCAAGTAQILGVEAYRDGTLVVADKAGRPARPQQPGTTGHAKLSSVCDPGFRTDAPSYADHRVARAAVPVGAVASAPKPALPSATPPAAAKAPATGEAERARGELRVIGFTADLVTMVAGPRPAKDTRTAEIWLWTFLPAEQSGGGEPYDASASRLRIDCAAGTTNAWGQAENYRNGELVQSLKSSGWPPRKEPPGSLGHLAIRASCEPDFASKLTALPDHRAAREASWKHFAQQGTASRTAAAKAPARAAPSAAQAQKAAKISEAESAGLPLRWVDGQADSDGGVVTMVAGPVPTRRPTAPVDAWFWTLFSEPISMGPLTYDTVAMRVTVDCAAGTVANRGMDSFLNDRLVNESYRGSKPAPGQKPTAGSAQHTQMRAVCEPGFAAKGQTVADHRAARAAALKYFSQQGASAQTAKAPAQSGPTPVTTGEKAAAAKSAEAGQRNLPRTPLRMAGVSQADGVVVMVSGPAPKVRPTAPFQVLTWNFHRDEQKAGATVYDTLAETRIADCTANTMRTIIFAAYREGKLIRMFPATGGTEAGAIKPGTIAHARLRAVCEPGYRADERSYSDYIEARAAVLSFFARNAAGTQPAPAPSGPTPVTAAEKAAAAKSAASATKSSQAAPPAQPKVGYAAVLPGPLRVYAAAPGTVQAIVGAKPQQRPSKPFETWIWIFDPGIKGAGNERFDSVAVRYRIDCAGGTLQPLLSETYLGEVARNPVKSSAAPSAPKPKTAGHDLLRAACDPQAKSLVYSDLRAARAAAAKYFASQKK